MNKALQDCKFFLKNGACTNKTCAYRHLVVAFTNHAAGKKCNKWPNCVDATCAYPHFEIPAGKIIAGDETDAPKKPKAVPTAPKAPKVKTDNTAAQSPKKQNKQPNPPKEGGSVKSLGNFSEPKAQRSATKVACIWDIENCAIPRGVVGSSLVQALRHQVGIGGPGKPIIIFIIHNSVLISHKNDY